MAATWTWAEAIVVGYAFLQDQGVLPYAMWGIANILALPLFGLVMLKWPSLWKMVEHPIYRAMLALYLFPVMWVNLQGLYEMTDETGLITGEPLRFGVMGVGLAIVGLIGIGGLRWSILSDQAQWVLTLLLTAGALTFVLFGSPGEPSELFLGTGSVLNWGMLAVVVLLTAPFLSAMQYERVREAGSVRPFLIAGATFGVFLAMMGIAGALSLNLGAATLLAALVLMASTSTIDSGASACQYITGGKWQGVVLGTVGVVTWPFVVRMGFLNLWATYSIIAVGVVLALFGVALWHELSGRKAVKRRELAEV